MGDHTQVDINLMNGVAFTSFDVYNGLQGEQGLQGEAGIQGETGLQGIQGIAGQNGTNGLQGIQGTRGLQGATGATPAMSTVTLQFTLADSSVVNYNVYVQPAQ